MDLFEIAIKLEQDGAAFYLNLAKHAPTEGFASLFKRLAEDEKKHESYFRALKEKSALISVDSSVLELAKSVFKGFDPETFEPEEDQIPLYEEALAIEQRSIDLYKSQINELEFDAERQAIGKIIEEEERHYIVMEELLKLVTRPHRWVENAEFGVREEY
jgi:rubrerythrin